MHFLVLFSIYVEKSRSVLRKETEREREDEMLLQYGENAFDISLQIG